MKKYTVYVEEVHTVAVEVEADSPEAARELANERILSGEDLPEAEYSHTNEPDEWDVEAK